MNLVLLISSFLILIGLFFTDELISIFASGFQGETLEAAVLLTRFSLIGIYFTLFIRILTAYLNYHKQFGIPNLIGIPMSLTVITSIFLSYHFYNISILAIGYISGLLFQFLILVVLSIKHNFRYVPRLKLSDKHLKIYYLLLSPLFWVHLLHNSISLLTAHLPLKLQKAQYPL